MRTVLLFVISCMVIINGHEYRFFGNGRKSDAPSVNPEAFMTTVQLIENRGYKAEVHHVTTEDGYIVELHRIPHASGKPVLLQHGLLGSAGFRLADKGYDVWMGNLRGNTYSRGHVTLNANQRQYWNFSYDEIGLYDIPAVVDYILEETGHQRLSYVGHSMGCAVYFIAMSTHPRLNQKIDLMLALAPASTVANMKSPLKLFAPHVHSVQAGLNVVQTRGFLSRDDWERRLQKRICAHRLKNSRICLNALFIIAGVDKENFDASLLPVIEGHDPAGTSTNVMAQFAQNYNAGIRRGQSFTRYDYGYLANLDRYGQPVPPSYNLTNVTSPVHIFWAENDLLTTPIDIRWLSNQLGNVGSFIRIEWDKFNHLDFLWALRVNELLYDRVLTLLPPP